MSFSSDYMERLYTVYPWPDNPFTGEGRERYEYELSVFDKVIRHEWVRKIVESVNDRIWILDVCGGAGIGGVAFAKVLREKYRVDTGLTIIDLRRNALRIAKEFSRKELEYEAETIIRNVLEKLDLARKYDFALLWGHSTPHFSPWDLVALYANIANLVKDNGLFIYDETDRVYTVFYLKGYKDVLPELVENNRIVLTIHKGRDYKTGFFHRVAYNLASGDLVDMRVYMWDIAGSASLAWVFFNDVDFIEVGRPYSGVVLAYKPRKNVDFMSFLESKPRMLSGTSRYMGGFS